MKQISKTEVSVYFITVFMTGLAVLVIEVAAVRQLTPIFGGSIYVLSSVLSVILLALSLGYFIGGRLSDKYPSATVLYRIITLSGISLLLLQFASITLLAGQPINSIIVGPMLVALMFFFLPAILLGMDSPYVIKLITHNSDESESGKYVGTTFFWSTIGSISGSLFAGFWFLPVYGVQNTITYTALMLVVLGLLCPLYLAGKNYLPYLRSQAVYLLGALLLAIGIVVAVEQVSAPGPNVLFQADGLYSQIIVKETEHHGRETITLNRDRNHSSAIFVDSYDHVFSYSQFADLYDVLVADPQHFLLIGGGAYTIPRRLVEIDETIEVSVMEIEPILFELAQEYFDLHDTSRITNYAGDARFFLADHDKEYDVIFSDAFNTAHSMPWQLGTVEFYEDLQSVLTPDGVVILNYIGAVDTNPENLTATFLNTLRTAFPHVLAFHSQTTDPNQIQNILFIASNEPIRENAISDFIITTRDNGRLPMSELAIDLSEIPYNPEGIFTDDLAPVEYLMGRQVRQYLKVI